MVFTIKDEFYLIRGGGLKLDIRLNKQWGISSDGHQYILQKYYGSFDKEGNENKNNVAYYGTYDKLISGLLEREIRSTKTTEVVDLAKILKEAGDEIVAKLDFLNGFTEVREIEHKAGE